MVMDCIDGLQAVDALVVETVASDPPLEQPGYGECLMETYDRLGEIWRDYPCLREPGLHAAATRELTAAYQFAATATANGE